MKRKVLGLLLSLVLCVGLAGNALAAVDFTVSDDGSGMIGGGSSEPDPGPGDDEKPGPSHSSDDDDDDDHDPSYSVSVSRPSDGSYAGGKVTVTPTSASKGDRVTLTVKPNSGYELESLVVTDSKGKELELTKVNDNRYTFTMPAGKVEVTPVFVKSGQASAVPQAGFSDVPAGAFFADAVAWAVARGVTNGTTATTFSPYASCTRAQMVTFLWRAAGSPAPKGTAKGFTDISAGAYYYNAVLWAVEQGITSGTTAETFSPDATCTRAQTVTFLYRSAGSPAAESAGFSDVDGGAYYANAVAWAVAQGVTNGTTAATFSPNSNCTRGQIVTFLYRYMA